MIYLITRATRHLLFCLLIVFAIGLTAIRITLPFVADYKADLEDKIQELTTIPIKIGTLRANMRGFSPELILKDIRVLADDEQAKPAIQLQEVRLGISLPQLLYKRELLSSSWLTLVGAKLSIVRQEDGTLSIVGLNTDDSEQPYWLLEGAKYEVLRSDITWQDMQRKGKPVEFKEVDMIVKNDIAAEKHEIHLISKLPEYYGEALRVSMSIQGNVFQENNISGLVYVEGRNIHLPQLLTGEIPLAIEIAEGEGGFKLWSRWENSELTGLTGNVQAQKVVLHKHNENKKPFKISKLASKFNGFIKEDSWQIGVSDLNLQTESQRWPVAEFNLSGNNQLNQIAATITRLDLQEMTRLFGFFVSSVTEKYSLITQLDLKGMLKDFSFFIDLTKNQYAVNGDFEGFFTNAYSKFDLPQLKNVSGSIKGTNSGGLIGLNTQEGALFFPKLFRQSFSIINLTGLLEWQQLSDEWQISSKSLVLETKDIQTETRIALTLPKNGEPIFMDLQALFSHSQDVSYAPEYYPASIMDIDLLEWLDNAFVSGKIEQGGVLVYGKLNEFPFSDGEGIFEVLYNMKDVELQYNSEWPNLNNVDADILFKRDSVTIDISHAEVNNLEIKQALVEIPSFAKSNHLFVQGLVEGRIVDGLGFLQQTPIHAPVDSFLDAITPVGLTQVELDLKIPLAENALVDVDGVAHFQNAGLKVKAVDLNVSELSGDLKFTENGLFSKKITAKTLGFPITINVDNENRYTSINIAGKTDFFQLKKQFDFFDTNVIKAGDIKGTAAYQVKLDLPAVDNESAVLKINSNLNGVAMDLPDKLNKDANQKRPLSLNLLLNENKLLPLTLNYDNQLKAAIKINKQHSTLDSANIVYGHGPAVSPVQKGINIKVEQDIFDASEWIKIASMGNNKKQKSDVGLNGLSVITKQLQWENKNYGPFELAFRRFAKEWNGSLSCAAAKGAFVLPRTGKGKEHIKLNMAYLNLSELMELDFQGINFSTDDLPLIHVSSDKLLWNNSNLGKLEIETERLLDGVRFNRIDIQSNNHKINLKADWIKNKKGSMTTMDGRLSADDFGQFLSRINIDNDIEDAKATVDYRGNWQGSPYQFSLQAMNAEMDVDIKDGRISSIEPGFGRILGLLAMEQWIKRLTLDFRDIYQEGLSFNRISGHHQLKQGKAKTENLLVDAVPARISIKGETNLLTKTLNHTVRVVPKSSAAVPIAGTIVGGIAGKITAFLANDYKEGYFFGSKYLVTGGWDDIQVTPLPDQDGIFKKTWEGLTGFSWMKSGPK